MNKYNITGMSCAACQNRVEKAVSKVAGVDSVSVSLLTNSMQVEGNANEKDIFDAVKKAGYGISSAGGKRSRYPDTINPKKADCLFGITYSPYVYINGAYDVWLATPGSYFR